jgi:hypothetical protein
MTILDTDDHVRPADALDVLLGELLDLQHDLADTVVWLAETWPADLRAPALTHQVTAGPRYGHRLWVYLNDAAELRRAAATLGVPLLVDASTSGHGDRWVRAVRSFGRVEVEAFGPAALIDGEAGS